uniref:sulfatase-like hydrolase/transferase n=1 Tax=Aquiflexum sp. TaxID=1872584 RepID=UPI00359439F7
MQLQKIMIAFLSVLLFTDCQTSQVDNSKNSQSDRISNNLQSNRPNIIVILADDMGYSDLGSYGSEIETPELDTLAKNGLRFSQFYNTARCCPTRASLLT